MNGYQLLAQLKKDEKMFTVPNEWLPEEFQITDRQRFTCDLEKNEARSLSTMKRKIERQRVRYTVTTQRGRDKVEPMQVGARRHAKS